jgi:hypothetical protein
MRVRTYFRLAGIAVAIVAVLIVAHYFGALSFLPEDLLSSLGVTRSRQTRSSRIVLQEVRDVYQLNTIEYVYRTVFPYDFMDPSVSLEGILQTLRTGHGSIESLLSPVELDFFQAYNLSREVGLSVGGDQHEFIVVTVIVGAGFDLAGSILAGTSELTEEEIDSLVTIEEEGRGRDRRRTIELSLPEPVITHVLVEDRDRDSYPYPDVSIEPDEWRRIADFVSERVRRRTIEEGILTEAAERGRAAVRSLLLRSGYDKVEFPHDFTMSP